jgi:hypothetical protein
MWGAELRRRQKVHETPSHQKKVGTVTHACHLQLYGEVYLVRPEQNMKPHFKHNRSKKDWWSGLGCKAPV